MNPGRILRQKWADESRETPQRIAERVRAREIGQIAHAETVAKFGELTPENAAQAIAFQEERVKALHAQDENPIDIPERIDELTDRIRETQAARADALAAGRPTEDFERRIRADRAEIRRLIQTARKEDPENWNAERE